MKLPRGFQGEERLKNRSHVENKAKLPIAWERTGDCDLYNWVSKQKIDKQMVLGLGLGPNCRGGATWPLPGAASAMAPGGLVEELV